MPMLQYFNSHACPLNRLRKSSVCWNRCASVTRIWDKADHTRDERSDANLLTGESMVRIRQGNGRPLSEV